MIINTLASTINSFVIKCYSANIPFYVIIIGLFIFDVVIYVISRFITIARFNGKRG